MNDDNKFGLKDVYSDFFVIGTAINTDMITRYGDIIINEYSSITPENEFKFCNIHPQEDVYYFDDMDYLIKYAKKNHMLVRGHTLVWHECMSDWLVQDEEGGEVSADVLIRRIEQHIHSVVGRYIDDIYCYDVINEVISDDENEMFRDTILYRIGREELIERAFIAAHEAAPKAKLYINDYNACIPHKCEKIYRLVKHLIDKGIPIHGIGLQGHYNINFPSAEAIDEALLKLSKLGLDIQITEMDISMYGYENRCKNIHFPTNEMLERQKVQYNNIFKMYRKYSDIISSVTLWGVADDYTWLDDFPVEGRKDWPLLYDDKLRRKSCYDAIVRIE